MYEGDSFLTLGQVGRVGLLMLSGALALGLAWLVRRLGRGRSRALRAGLALSAFWIFLWCSPQIYYVYYMTLFDGLPWQNVVKTPPGLCNVLSLLTFTDTASLSNHGKGLMGWGLIAVALWRETKRP